MRSVAQFIMRGRGVAVLVAMVATASGVLFWLGGAVVALITLRKGALEGSTLLAATLIPATWWAYNGDLLPLGTLAGVYPAALLLRRTGSWPWALCYSTFNGILLALVLAGPARRQLESTLLMIQTNMATLLGPEHPAHTEFLADSLSFAGFLAIACTILVVIGLLIGRGCQSLLYNPGGFRQEFHQLRMALPQILFLSLLALACLAREETALWAWIVCVPLGLAGLALLHGYMDRRRLRTAWLLCLDTLLILFAPLALVAIACADSCLDLRRWMRDRDPDPPPSG